jgi:hypothetical protein
LVVEHWQ